MEQRLQNSSFDVISLSSESTAAKSYDNHSIAKVAQCRAVPKTGRRTAMKGTRHIEEQIIAILQARLEGWDGSVGASTRNESGIDVADTKPSGSGAPKEELT
jgi:hypothetical protein